MRTRATLIAMALAGAGALPLAQAFEPGHERICTPSADGQTFECRDKAGGQPEASPVKPAAAVAAPVRAAESVPPAAAPAASKLPNYLMQNPSATEPVHVVEAPAEVAPAASVIETAATDDPARAVAPAQASPAAAAPIHPVASVPAPDIEAAASAKTPAPAVAPEPAAQASPAIPATIALDAPAPAPAEPRLASPASAPATSRDVADAGAFRALPGSHYTLVLASVRDPAALDELIQAFAAQPGQLYLLKLGMPDGDWYSLCWSDFANLDAARAARASLPAEAPIRSGWPRRIDLLQKEIAR